MNPKNSLWQFIKDGLVGIVVVLIPFAILATLFIFQNGADWFVFVTGMFFFPDPVISPMPFVILIGFISMGIGGRFLENITSRWSLLKHILIITIVAWISGVVLFQIAFIKYSMDWDILGLAAAGAGAGFLIAGLAGVIFNPTKRLFRLIIGSIASTVVAYVVGIWIFVSQTMQ